MVSLFSVELTTWISDRLSKLQLCTTNSSRREQLEKRFSTESLSENLIDSRWRFLRLRRETLQGISSASFDSIWNFNVIKLLLVNNPLGSIEYAPNSSSYSLNVMPQWILYPSLSPYWIQRCFSTFETKLKHIVMDPFTSKQNSIHKIHEITVSKSPIDLGFIVMIIINNIEVNSLKILPPCW